MLIVVYLKWLQKMVKHVFHLNVQRSKDYCKMVHVLIASNIPEHRLMVGVDQINAQIDKYYWKMASAKVVENTPDQILRTLSSSKTKPKNGEHVELQMMRKRQPNSLVSLRIRKAK